MKWADLTAAEKAAYAATLNSQQLKAFKKGADLTTLKGA